MDRTGRLRTICEGSESGFLNTNVCRHIGAGVLGVSIVITVWLALKLPNASIYLLLACNLLLALLLYVMEKQRRVANAGNLTLQQAIRNTGTGGADDILQTVINGLADPVLVIDMNFQITAMNTAAQADCGELLREHENLECRCAMARLGTRRADPDRPCVLKSGTACRYIQERCNAEGVTRPVEIRMAPLMDADGEFAGAVEVVHDLSDSEQRALNLRQARDDAETVSRAKSECVAMMSHEVRTPMNAVLGMADLLQLTDLTRKQQDYVRTIQSSSSVLLSLVDNVIDYSELQAGKLVMRRRPFDVRVFVEQIVEIMGFQAYSKGLELGCRVDSDVPQLLRGDADRLRQVLVNLISNAVRYSIRGEVSITVRMDVGADGERSVVWAVNDTGVGIPSGVQAGLFVPFGRNDQREQIGKHGSGLGLTVCKWLVEGMAGRISIDSADGRGTRVSFKLPLAAEATDAAPAAALEPLQGRRALVMHSNQRMAALIGEYLSDRGMSWDVKRNADVGLQCLLAAMEAGKPYDTVIIDASLPGTDGICVARQIRAESRIVDTPIILLTPIAYPLKVGEISSIGRIRCINKPVMPTEMCSKLSSMLTADGARSMSDDAASDAAAGGLRILIAEDNDLSRQLLQNMLASLNYPSDAVAAGPDALQALGRESYDVVLMDCQMPGMDGDEVTRVVRSHPEEYPTQPVIVAVTADVSAQHRAACRDAGMDDFLGKPVRRRQLIEGLQHWRVDLEKIRRGAADTPEVLEKAVLEQLQSRGDNYEFLCDYIDLFLADTNSRLKLLDAATASQDWDTVRRQSHALKGACLEMGAAAMGEQCGALQAASLTTEAGGAPDALRDLKKEFEHIQPAFEAAKRHFI